MRVSSEVYCAQSVVYRLLMCIKYNEHIRCTSCTIIGPRKIADET